MKAIAGEKRERIYLWQILAMLGDLEKMRGLAAGIERYRDSGYRRKRLEGHNQPVKSDRTAVSQPGLPGFDDRLGAVCHLQFVEDAGNVIAYGFAGDVEPGSNLVVV